MTDECMKAVRSLPFPWRCAECGLRAIYPYVVGHEVPFTHEGKTRYASIEQLPVNKCVNCGCVLATDEGEMAINEAIKKEKNK